MSIKFLDKMNDIGSLVDITTPRTNCNELRSELAQALRRPRSADPLLMAARTILNGSIIPVDNRLKEEILKIPGYGPSKELTYEQQEEVKRNKK